MKNILPVANRNIFIIVTNSTDGEEYLMITLYYMFNTNAWVLVTKKNRKK